MSPRRIECTTRAPGKGARLSAPQAGKEVATVTFFNHKGLKVERKVFESGLSCLIGCSVSPASWIRALVSRYS